MFKRTAIKLSSSKPPAVLDLLNLGQSKHIKDQHLPNDELLSHLKSAYELRGEYLPRRKINPFRRKPLKVNYDQSQFMGFVMPSKRVYYHGMFEQDELFGVRRWRNDSPFMKEYIKVDNQVMLLVLVLSLAGVLWFGSLSRRIRQTKENIILTDMGKFTAEDLI